MKILVIEDEQSLQELVARALLKEHYVVEVASTYGEAWEKLSMFSYDCVLLDIMLPDGNGLDLLKAFRKEGKSLTVIILSARNSLEDKVIGLEEGADDYLPKPFHTAELLARIKSVTRRSSGRGSNEIVYGNVKLNPHSRSRRKDIDPGKERIRHPSIFSPQAGPYGRQIRLGRSCLGRRYLLDRQLRLHIFAGEEPPQETGRSRS